MHRLGVRQMELVNKFDNALTGVAGDNGESGVAVNSANFLETGSFWDMRHCPSRDPDGARPATSSPRRRPIGGRAAGRALRRDRQAVRDLANLPALPLYRRPRTATQLGLTTLGEHARQRAGRQADMLFDPDHMSVKARRSCPRLSIEDRRLPRRAVQPLVVHARRLPADLPAGGFIAPYAGDSHGLRREVAAAPRLGRQPLLLRLRVRRRHERPRRPGRPARRRRPEPGDLPVHRPAAASPWTSSTAASGCTTSTSTASRTTACTPTGSRTCAQLGGRRRRAIVDDMARGAEAYLQMWERAEGIAPDSCRNPGLRAASRRSATGSGPG